MGTQFFWFYDIVVIAIIIAIILKCSRKGFVSTIVGLVSVVVAFAVALSFSGVIADAVYGSYVEKALLTNIQEQFDDVLDQTVVGEINSIDMSKAKVNGKLITEITPEIDATGKYTLTLDSADFSKTGIAAADLSAFGIDKDTNFSSVNLGTIVISQSELDEYGLQKMLLVSYLADNMTSGTLFGAVRNVTQLMAEKLPQIMTGFSNSVNNGETDKLKQIILSVIDTETGDFAQSVLDTVVKPVVLIPIRALIFVLLFVIITLILGFLTRALRIVNKIPLIGTLNSLLGAAVGVAEAAVIVFIVCIGIQVIINLTGNSLIFINTMTINETFLFKHIYNFNFLNLLH